MSKDDLILRVNHLSMKFGGLVAISDLSFGIKRHQITALIGPNGAGKTTAFNCITGFYRPTTGMITLTCKDGSKHLLERTPGYLINKQAKIARTFQNIRLFKGMTVFENLLVAQHNSLFDSSIFNLKNFLNLKNQKAEFEKSVEKAKFWLKKVNLIKRADEAAGNLPYGDQRRLEIIRAMCTDPELLCLDEPAAGLNPKESLELNVLLETIRETGTSILLIEHDMSVVMGISDHVIVLEYGNKISDGSPEFVRNDPRVIAAYLGIEDEEMETDSVEKEEHVLVGLDAEPDFNNGPGCSSSMMAGSIVDTIVHSDPQGEVIRISTSASKAHLVDTIVKAKKNKKGSSSDLQKEKPIQNKKSKSSSKKPSNAEKIDDFLLIKGLDLRSSQQLNKQGVLSFDQIAAWKKNDVVSISKALQIEELLLRSWIKQAKELVRTSKKEKSFSTPSIIGSLEQNDG